MNPPKELSPTELKVIADRVRLRMVSKFGSQRTELFFFNNIGMIIELMRQTYIAVREQIEETKGTQL